jgi:hypothetical protein
MEVRMSHQDVKSEGINREAVKQAIDVLLPTSLFRTFAVRKGATWRGRILATAAFLWGCLNQGTLEQRFVLARNIAGKIFHWFPAPGKTFEGFKKVLKARHLEIRSLLMESWRDRMILLPAPWTLEGYLIVAVDGSRVELPRTRSHEEHFAAGRQSNRKSQKKKARTKQAKKKAATARAQAPRKAAQQSESTKKKLNSPQMWLTLIWHVGTGLPWEWKFGPSDSSERDHLREMLAELPKNTLITADAGFVGYDFWKAIEDTKLRFLIRVGGNVKLIRNLGYARQQGHTVYLWPKEAMRRRQPPLVLRLIVLHDGKQPVYLVTNMTKAEMSDRQGATIYQSRWGIELFFRTYKQTFERRKLRSHKAEFAELELEWSLLALWGMLLAGQIALHDSGQSPQRQSPVQTIRVFQETIIHHRVRPATADASLWLGLRAAVLDDYERTSEKSSRNYPKKKERERTTAPSITEATNAQRLAAQQLKETNQEFRLAA